MFKKSIITLTTLTTLTILLLSPSSINAQTFSSYITNKWLDNRYTVHGNGTATDNETGLMWKVCSEGQTWSDNGGNGNCSGTAGTYTWKVALEHAKQVNDNSVTHGGLTIIYTDWQVPNHNQLKSITALDRHSPAINLTIFPNVASINYWTSSPSIINTNSAISISTGYVGKTNHENRTKNNHLRLVRTNQ